MLSIQLIGLLHVTIIHNIFTLSFRDHLPESAFMYQLLGLNLLFLLSQNRVAEFHTELERLSVDVIRADPYVKHPLALEQYLMEGSYNKIFLAKVKSIVFKRRQVYCK